MRIHTILLVILTSTHILYTQETKPVVQAIHIQSPIIMDGKLSENSWKTANVISDFTQRELEEGKPATEHTSVKILFDEKNIYIGIMCYDKNPNKIIHNELKRDGKINDDDNIAFILDTYHDYRSGYYFQVNANGARCDGLYSGEEHINYDWNGVWDVATQITNEGWCAEIVIPIKSLRFPVNNTNKWGFNIQRTIKHKLEEVLWTSWQRNDGLLQLYKAGTITGLQQLRMKRMVEVKPFLLTGQETDFNKQNINTLKYGIDIKYPIASNLVLDMTTFTDFAQVESDRNQINLSRFNIRYPEKRDFFLEGSGVYNFGLRGGDVFYSRRIGITDDRQQVPILVGARLTGKTGKYRIGLLNVQTDKENNTASTNYGVVRLQRDIYKNSSIGIIATNKSENDKPSNQTVGADFTYRTLSFLGNNNLIISGAIAGTIKERTTKNNIAHSIYIDYPNDTFENYLSYSVIPKNFDPEIGYVNRKGIKTYGGAFRWTPRPDFPFIKKIIIKPIELKYLTNMDNVLMSRNYELRPLGIEFNSGDKLELNKSYNYENLDEDFNIFNNVVIPKGIYSWWDNEIQYEGSGKRKIQADISIKFGDFYTGYRTEYDQELLFKINENIALSTMFQINRINAENQSFITREYSSRLVVNFSTRLTSRTFIQWNNEDKRVYLNFLINFIPKIGSDMYFVYNQVWDGYQGYRIHSKTGIAKIAYMIRF